VRLDFIDQLPRHHPAHLSRVGAEAEGDAALGVRRQLGIGDNAPVKKLPGLNKTHS
jgi:hypothetical protein